MSDYNGYLHRGFDLSRFINRLMDDGGWDDPDAVAPSLDDCDGKIRTFLQAVSELKERLEQPDGLEADTDQQIVALAMDPDTPWGRYVDPRLSRARLHPTNGSLIVLWECSEHSVGLHDTGYKKWKVIADLEQLEMIRDSWLDDDFEDDDIDDILDDIEPESNDLPRISVDLNAEDVERRRLLSADKRGQLEPVSDPDGLTEGSGDAELRLHDDSDR